VLVIVVVIKLIRRKEHLLFVPTSFSFCSVFVYILIGNNNKQTINLSFSFFFEDTFRWCSIIFFNTSSFIHVGKKISWLSYSLSPLSLVQTPNSPLCCLPLLLLSISVSFVFSFFFLDKINTCYEWLTA